MKPDITERLADVADLKTGISGSGLTVPWMKHDPMWSNNRWAQGVSMLCHQARTEIELVRKERDIAMWSLVAIAVLFVAFVVMGMAR